LLAAAAASSSPAAAADLTCANASASPAHLSTTAARHSLLCLVNRVRGAHGLRALRPEPRLLRAATGHAADMVSLEYFDHDGPDGTLTSRVRATGYLRHTRRWRLGEALAWGRGRTGTPRGLLASLMASPPHRALLLDAGFRELGLGLAHGSPQGPGAAALTLTLDFGRRG
jgi:uncharacterized protein YkwD